MNADVENIQVTLTREQALRLFAEEYRWLDTRARVEIGDARHILDELGGRQIDQATRSEVALVLARALDRVDYSPPEAVDPQD